MAPKHKPTPESPFMPVEPVRFGFGTIMIMLWTVVAAGLGMLLFYAMRVPAITSELNAWFGRSVAMADSVEGRRAQVIFALLVYSAPLGLAFLVYVMHHGVRWMDRLTRGDPDSSDDAFRME